MSAPLSTSGASSELQTWQELEDVFASLGQMARASVAPHQFYRTLLEQSVRALAADGGAVWLRAPNGAMHSAAQAGKASAGPARNEAVQVAHQALLAQVAARGAVSTVGPHAESEKSVPLNLTDHVLVLGPVHRLAEESPADKSGANHDGQMIGSTDRARGKSTQRGVVLAIIELWIRADAGPATYRGAEQFLMSVCELASDYHAFDERRRLLGEDQHRSELLALGRRVHRNLNLSSTAYEVANEARRVVGCDRLSVLVGRGRRCRLLATSGVSRVERRSGAARRLAKIASMVRRTDEPAYYADGQSDAMPPVAEAMERHVAESHARHIAAIPLAWPVDPTVEASSLDKKRVKRRRPAFVLIAEQFDGREGELRRDWLVEVGQVCATALYNAWEVDRTALRWLLRPVGKVTHAVASHLPRTILALAAVATAAYALFVVPADFNIESPGTLQPKVRRDVFAPRTGIVDEVLVEHGATVAVGQPLVKMRDPTLELEMKRVDGELETAQRQLDAVQAMKTNRAVRDPTPVDSYRLSAEERELEQKLANSRRELELLQRERDQLVVNSPIAGKVLTMDLGHQLLARPVERGEILVTVADVKADWLLELDVPDDRIGYVLAAQREMKRDLPVHFRLSSDEREEHAGRLTEICQTANVGPDKASRPKPTILAKVSFDTAELQTAAGGELRPGISARAQIECGRRPIGYVWLHDIWDAAVQWWRF